MDGLKDEIKAIPPWAWFAIASVVLAAFVMLRKRAPAASSSGSFLNPPVDPNALQAGAGPGDVATMTLEQLSNIATLIQGQTAAAQLMDLHVQQVGAAGVPAPAYSNADKANQIDGLYLKYFGRKATNVELYGDGNANAGWVNVFGDLGSFNAVEGMIRTSPAALANNGGKILPFPTGYVPTPAPHAATG